MATSPFGNVGLGQFGQDSSFSSGSGGEGGIGSVLLSAALTSLGVPQFLNKSLQPAGIEFSDNKFKAIKPPERLDVKPSLNTGMPASQPFAMSPQPLGMLEPVGHQEGLDYIKAGY